MKAVLSHSKPLFEILKALNVYKINLFIPASKLHVQNRKSDIPAIFNDIVKRPGEKYQTKFSKLNNILRKYSLTNSRFSNSFRRPKLSNEIVNKEEKELESHTLFKKCVKLKLLNMENEYFYF